MMMDVMFWNVDIDGISDEYCHVTIHYMILYMHSLLISFVLFHRKDVLWLRRH
jgi:hypothetical protein